MVVLAVGRHRTRVKHLVVEGISHCEGVLEPFEVEQDELAFESKIKIHLTLIMLKIEK